MTDVAPRYADLDVEDSWIEYVRTRLPYSFESIEGNGSRRTRRFVLSGPVLLSGPMKAEWHNYWERGNVYYMSGKLLDYFSMSQIGRYYRLSEVIQLLTNAAGAAHRWPTDPFAFYNSMQLEKVWAYAQHNYLDRERVMLTDVALAVELGLKAIMTHANYRQARIFQFSAGHKITDLYNELPLRLRDEIADESNTFAKDYSAFRGDLEAEIQRIFNSRSAQSQVNPDLIRQAEYDWNQMAARIRESNYTAFVNSNDPGHRLQEHWFEKALDDTNQTPGFRDLAEYVRYAPLKDKDGLPIHLVTSVLLLGRFIYEHLFPVPYPGDGPISGFPIG